MSHNHSHDGHGHNHGVVNNNRAFVVSVVLNTGFVLVEAIYGILANSLALLADAGHNLSDVLGLLLAWGATILARRLPTARRTYATRTDSFANAQAIVQTHQGSIEVLRLLLTYLRLFNTYFRNFILSNLKCITAFFR